jgi:hypothetical protein
MVEIENSALLVALFGHWPDFHDGEIRQLRIDAGDHRGPSVEIDLEVTEKSADVDARGYYKDRQRARVTLRFENVGSLRLEGSTPRTSWVSCALSQRAREIVTKSLVRTIRVRVGDTAWTGRRPSEWRGRSSAIRSSCCGLSRSRELPNDR